LKSRSNQFRLFELALCQISITKERKHKRNERNQRFSVLANCASVRLPWQQGKK